MKLSQPMSQFLEWGYRCISEVSHLTTCYYDPVKGWELLDMQHSVTSQATWTLSNTIFRTSKLTTPDNKVVPTLTVQIIQIRHLLSKFLGCCLSECFHSSFAGSIVTLANIAGFPDDACYVYNRTSRHFCVNHGFHRSLHHQKCTLQKKAIEYFIMHSLTAHTTCIQLACSCEIRNALYIPIKFPAFCGTGSFVTVFQQACQLFIISTSRNVSTFHSISLRPTSTFTSHIYQ